MWKLSTEIYQEKIRALNQGDETVVEQIGRGKDIMSVLSEWMSFNCGLRILTFLQ
jgi:hypothetical protein